MGSSKGAYRLIYTEVYTKKNQKWKLATSLQPGQIRHLLRVTSATSRHPEHERVPAALYLP
jgi:hypothetical protein